MLCLFALSVSVGCYSSGTTDTGFEKAVFLKEPVGGFGNYGIVH
jgi:hypothetical protein